MVETFLVLHTLIVAKYDANFDGDFRKNFADYRHFFRYWTREIIDAVIPMLNMQTEKYTILNKTIY